MVSGIPWAVVGAEQGCGKIDTLEVTRKPILPELLAEVAVNIIMSYY